MATNQPQYSHTQYDETLAQLTHTWASHPTLEDEAFAQELEALRQGLGSQAAHRLLLEWSNCKHILTPDNQDTLVEWFGQLTQEHPIRRIAVVLSVDFFAQVAQEQFIDDFKKAMPTIPIAAFKDVAEAQEWLGE
ncbi:STAS/SEC14 domain-containing protein [Eisenibacter elegans]|jgi:hypothetical protein|uniref:STAS/SEC14 domain-containing protein n=1 Tax=Eisenibacter elegans TaxID=997 RepID=UPI00047C10A7|nr:STAS/SEC14 domain-containing protein [Eisenibacter elegans]